MSPRFRPQLNALEAREVPAAFSALLPNGSDISGQFSTPAGVTQTQTQAAQTPQVVTQQTLAIPTLTISESVPGSTTGGTKFTVQSATATYQNGVLVGVNATATDSNNDSLTVNLGTVTVGSQSGSVVYDAADTQQTFTLPDGTVGAISFTTPYDSINQSQSSQTLPLTALNLNIAGKNYTYGTANFTTAPTIQFSYGDQVGINFAINTPGSPYLSVAVANAVATVQNVSNGQFVTAPVADTTAEIVLDFSTLTMNNKVAQDVTITVKAGNTTAMVTVSVEPGSTATDVRDAIQRALTAKGISAISSGTTKLIIQGTTGPNPSELTTVDAFNFKNLGGTLKLVTRTAGADNKLPTYSPANS